MIEQLSFPLPTRSSFAAADFFPGAPSETARKLLDRTPSWPLGKLILIGTSGSGKSHLLHIWAEETGALIADPAKLPNRADQPVAFDGADQVAGDPVAEEALFHLHNNLAAAGHPLLLTARRAPSLWDLVLPDLKSRMEGTSVVTIEEPDDDTLGAILLKLMADRQLNPAPNLVRYLIPRIRRSYAEAAAIVAALDTRSLAEKREITTALAGQVLDAWRDQRDI